MNEYVDNHIKEFVQPKQDYSKIEQLIKKIICDYHVPAKSIFTYLLHEYNVIYKQIDTTLRNMGFELGIIDIYILNLISNSNIIFILVQVKHSILQYLLFSDNQFAYANQYKYNIVLLINDIIL